MASQDIFYTVRTLHQELVELRGRVRAWLESGRTWWFSPWHGICDGLALPSSDRDHLCYLMAQWPGHSGYSKYPVPHPTLGPEAAFDLATPQGMWDPQSAYARNRWALLDWLIEQTAQANQLGEKA